MARSLRDLLLSHCWAPAAVAAAAAAVTLGPLGYSGSSTTAVAAVAAAAAGGGSEQQAQTHLLQQLGGVPLGRPTVCQVTWKQHHVMS